MAPAPRPTLQTESEYLHRSSLPSLAPSPVCELRAIKRTTGPRRHKPRQTRQKPWRELDDRIGRLEILVEILLQQ